ncbi:MAG: maltotransferase domain-containing protein [Acidimicrobiia bacterium]
MTPRLVIENLRPRAPGGRPAKTVAGRPLRVAADVFRDGHDLLSARLLWRRARDRKWLDSPMVPLGNDRYETSIEPVAIGAHELVIEAWTDRFGTWRAGVMAKHQAGAPLDGEAADGAAILESRVPQLAKRDRPRLLGLVERLRREEFAISAPELLAEVLDPALAEALSRLADPTDLASAGPYPLWVDRERALVGAWYELFPRSEGGLTGSVKRLSEVADMGFDVVYLPPIHPIGRRFRKGINNALVAGPDDPGSPWAIGGPEGGHTAIHPDLGKVSDFDRFVETAGSLGMEVALDYALQCSPDHPWLTDHPEWFHHRADGTIRYAENPPKKDQDIYPLNLWAPEPARSELWTACKEILDYWIAHRVRIFRVDNPHTKPFPFWDW